MYSKTPASPFCLYGFFCVSSNLFDFVLFFSCNGICILEIMKSNCYCKIITRTTAFASICGRRFVTTAFWYYKEEENVNIVSSVPCEDTELLTERHNDNTNWGFFLLSSIEKTASCGFCWFFLISG